MESPPQSSNRPVVHPADWTAERVATFWDNYASIPHLRARFFSLTWGEGILEFAERFVPTKGVFLDYGCGQGDLTQVLLQRDRRCMGVDSSPEGIRITRQRFTNDAAFLGAFLTPHPQLPAVPDTVMLVEVIEHMPRTVAGDFLRGIAALLPQGGHVVVTCPNRENIVDAQVLCPECGCCFHPVQHMQSLAPSDVATLAEGAGFDTVYAGATRFRRKGELGFIRAIIVGWYWVFRCLPHLVYIGRKK